MAEGSRPCGAELLPMLGRGGVAATARDGCRRLAAAASMTAAQAEQAMAGPADKLEVWSFFISCLFNRAKVIGSYPDQPEHSRCSTSPRGYDIRFIGETCSLQERGNWLRNRETVEEQ